MASWKSRCLASDPSDVLRLSASTRRCFSSSLENSRKNGHGENNTDVLDLSYSNLSFDQICLLLQKFPDTRILDLSHNPLVTTASVKHVLATETRVRKLILFNSPVSTLDWPSLLEESPELFNFLEAVIRPGFIESEVLFSPQFIFAAIGQWEEECFTEMPFFTPSQIVQALLVLFGAISRSDRILRVSNVIVGDAPSAALSSETLRPGASWLQREIPYFSRKPNKPTGTLGWVFYVRNSWRTGSHFYAFVQMHRDALTSDDFDTNELSWKMHDLDGFLREMDNEGRPKSDLAVVDELKRVFGATRLHPKERPTANRGLMSEKDVEFLAKSLSRK